MKSLVAALFVVGLASAYASGITLVGPRNSGAVIKGPATAGGVGAGSIVAAPLPAGVVTAAVAPGSITLPHAGWGWGGAVAPTAWGGPWGLGWRGW